MPELPLCTKCHGEPRVPGQRWGLACRAAAEAARRAKVPHETRGTVSRRERKRELEEWLQGNRERVERDSVNALAAELKRKGFYSEKTGIIDIRVSLSKHCRRLGITLRNQSRWFFVSNFCGVTEEEARASGKIL